jgi:primase-polymerase (primpol)-like protein
VRTENARLLKQVDRIFTDKKGKEAACTRVEAQIASHYAEAEAQLQDLTEEQRATYYELQALNKQYIADISLQTEEIKTIGDRFVCLIYTYM